MRAINLLPKDAERARRTTPDPALLAGVVGIAIVIVALGWMFMSASQKVQSRQGQRDDLAARLDEINKLNQKPVLPIQPAIAAVEAPRVAAVSSALGYRVPWDFVLGQIARALPAGVKLTTLNAVSPVSPNPTVQQQVTSASGTGHSLELDGWTYDQESVALLMTRLQRLSSLDGSTVFLQSSTKNAAGVKGQRAYYQFVIFAQVKAPGQSSATPPPSAATTAAPTDTTSGATQ